MKKELLKLLESCVFTGKIAKEYYGGANSYFMRDKYEHDMARRKSYNLLAKISRLDSKKVKEACKMSWGGRLQFNGKSFEYIPGQFYNLELPQAIASMLDYYLKNN